MLQNLYIFQINEKMYFWLHRFFLHKNYKVHFLLLILLDLSRTILFPWLHYFYNGDRTSDSIFSQLGRISSRVTVIGLDIGSLFVLLSHFLPTNPHSRGLAGIWRIGEPPRGVILSNFAVYNTVPRSRSVKMYKISTQLLPQRNRHYGTFFTEF